MPVPGDKKMLFLMKREDFVVWISIKMLGNCTNYLRTQSETLQMLLNQWKFVSMF